MKNKFGFTLLIVLGLVMASFVVRGEESTPTNGAATGNYTFSLNAEAGWRFLGTNGNFNKYRSDLNYGRGPRLFDFDFLVRSNDNKGKVFDTFHVQALGWGGDPNQFLRVEAEKTKIYRFDMNYREFHYFNNLTNLALNQHTADNSRRFGDFNITLGPQSEKFKVYLGYTLDYSLGRTFTTYDYSRDEFPVFSPLRNLANDYRMGFDASFKGVDISFLQGYRSFKEDTTFIIPSLNLGNNPANSTFINFFQREIPTRGTLPFTRFSLHTLIKNKLDFTGRFIYTSTSTRFDMSEFVTGKDFSGNNVILDQFLGTGNAKRPNALGDFGFTFFATDKLTVSETFRVNSFRINGGDRLSESLFRTRTTAFGTTTLPPLFLNPVSFRLISYRQYLNTIEGDYKFSPRFSGHLGYRYTNRRIDMGASDQPPVSALDSEVTKNRTNSVFAGFKARPASMWTIYFDFERGATDNVFTRVANYDFTNFRVRTLIRPTKTLTINASLITKDNNNPTETLDTPPREFGANINTRIFTSSLDWTPNSKFLLTGGYTHSHIDSNAAIIFFLGGVKTSGNSLYFMKDNFFFFNTRVQVHPRAGIFLGYRINKDTGQGNRSAANTTEIVSSYPLSFQSPEVRLTFKLNEHLDWNLGWQYYNYHEKFLGNQNYHASMPFSSLRLSF